MENAQKTTSRGRLVAVISAKGGCGATLISVNLAAAGGDRTVLLDLDFSKGDVAGFLDVWPDRSLKDALGDAVRMDLSLLRGLVTQHKGGMDILPQPFDLSELVQPRAADIRRLLGLVREGWATAVADCGSRVDEATLTAAMDADEVILVAVASVPALRDARRVTLLLERLGVPRQRLHLVVNRWSGDDKLDRAEIEHHLEMPVVATIVRDALTCARADYAGKLLREVAPLSPISGDIDALWGLLFGEPGAPELLEGTAHRWHLWPHRDRPREET